MKEMVILRLEVESMKHQMVHAFSAHSEEIKREIELATERYLSSGRLQIELDRAIESTIQETIKSYFSYGRGRDLIRESVEALGIKND